MTGKCITNLYLPVNGSQGCSNFSLDTINGHSFQLRLLSLIQSSSLHKCNPTSEIATSDKWSQSKLIKSFHTQMQSGLPKISFFEPEIIHYLYKWAKCKLSSFSWLSKLVWGNKLVQKIFIQIWVMKKYLFICHILFHNGSSWIHKYGMRFCSC